MGAQGLLTWIAEEKQKLERFTNWYLVMRNVGAAGMWPLSMPPADWREQYHSYLSSEERPRIESYECGYDRP